ncbi:MAG: ABC transporter ATP-binding protein [Chloroflexi bacterium]|nr:MAG: ABC transporter ATP-binding protein [Chloroflexota bacterium]
MIEAENLGKVFDKFTAVHNLSLNIPPGQLLALLGPNGAGKTTTVRMLGSILQPTTGWAKINGFNVQTEAAQVRHAIGMLTEQPGLYLRMTGLEYLVFYGRLYGLSDADAKKRGTAMFKRFAMPGAEKRRLGEYSKGMRQKVGLIRSLLHDPAVLLLDEPTSAMDPHSAKLVRDAIIELRDDKRTVILCTHNLAEAELLADTIAIIKKGTIVAQGSVAQLKQQLLGHPQLEVRVDKHLNGEIKELQDLVTVEWVRDDVIRYCTSSPESTNPQIVRRLDGLGLGVITIKEITQSLEEVYLRVVSEEVEEI